MENIMSNIYDIDVEDWSVEGCGEEDKAKSLELLKNLEVKDKINFFSNYYDHICVEKKDGYYIVTESINENYGKPKIVNDYNSLVFYLDMSLDWI
jgi:hypothetical protein